MKYFNNYAKAFKYSVLFGADFDPETEEIIEYSIKNKEHILCAINKAYFDMTPRTVTNDGNYSKKVTESKRKHFCVFLSQKFYEYFNNIDIYKNNEINDILI